MLRRLCIICTRRSERFATGFAREIFQPAVERMPSVTPGDQPRAESPGPPLRVTLIGRGHSGTRAFVELMRGSGVRMHYDIRESYDYVGDCALYEAARIFGALVDRVGEYEWDFRRAIDAPIPPRFVSLMDRFLAPVDESPGHAGYKLPETILIFPWLARLRPDYHFVHWVRDPRDSLLHRHLTDGLEKFGVCSAARNIRWFFNDDERILRRVASWKYQHDLVAATPLPKHWSVVRFEDFVLHHDRVVGELGGFLGLDLQRIDTHVGAVGRWRGREMALPDLNLLTSHMRSYGYLPGHDLRERCAGSTITPAPIRESRAFSATAMR